MSERGGTAASQEDLCKGKSQSIQSPTGCITASYHSAWSRWTLTYGQVGTSSVDLRVCANKAKQNKTCRRCNTQIMVHGEEMVSVCIYKYTLHVCGQRCRICSVHCVFPVGDWSLMLIKDQVSFCISVVELRMRCRRRGETKESTCHLEIEQKQAFKCKVASEEPNTWRQLKCCDILHFCPSVWMSPVMRLGDKTCLLGPVGFPGGRKPCKKPSFRVSSHCLYISLPLPSVHLNCRRASSWWQDKIECTHQHRLPSFRVPLFDQLISESNEVK